MKVESKIHSVVVHREGATVTRCFALPAVARFDLGGLPVGAADGSLRVRPPRGVSVLSTRVSLEESPLRSLPREISEERRVVVAALARVAAEHAEIEHVLALVGALEPGVRPTPHQGELPRATVRGRLSLLRAADAVAESYLEQRASLAKERAALKIRAEELRLAEAALDARRAAAPLSKSLEVTLSAAHAAEGAVAEVSYFLRGAGWCPTYTLRLSGGRAVVEVRASVAQRTGESWEDVALSVTTADASAYVDLPELESLRIGRSQALKPRRGYRPLEDSAELLTDFVRSLRSAEGAAGGVDVGVLSQADEEESTPLDDALQRSLTAPGPETSYGAPQGFAPPASFARSLSAPGAMGDVRASIPHPQAPAPQSGPHEARAALVGGPMGGGLPLGALPRSRRKVDPEPSSIAPDPRWLSFDALRLPPPRESRGKLVARDPRDLYLESLPRGSELAQRVDEALAPRSELARLPPRHSPPTSDLGFHHRIRGRSKVTIPSDGEWHAVPLLSDTVDAKRSFVVVPRESTDVYRRVELMSPFDVPLLVGPCDVYVDGEFLSTTELETVPPRGAVSVGIGVEQAIKVVRNTTFREASEGLMSGTNALHHHVSVEARSHLDGPAHLEVRERVPVLEEKEENIKVEIAEVRPAWSPLPASPRHPAVRGAHRWGIELRPGEAVTLSLHYVVRISSKHELVHGNRREP
jgi:hypothetical protein